MLFFSFLLCQIWAWYVCIIMLLMNFSVFTTLYLSCHCNSFSVSCNFSFPSRYDYQLGSVLGHKILTKSPALALIWTISCVTICGLCIIYYMITFFNKENPLKQALHEILARDKRHKIRLAGGERDTPNLSHLCCLPQSTLKRGRKSLQQNKYKSLGIDVCFCPCVCEREWENFHHQIHYYQRELDQTKASH